MFIKRVQLNNYRNYIHLDMEFHRKVNILLGKNAQGKTNLIESIYMASLGKSFRTSKDQELIRFGSDSSKIKICSEKNEEESCIDILIKKEGKEIKIDGYKLTKISEMLDHIYVVVFSPEDLRIVKDEPEKRRKFIDRELSQLKPVYYDDLLRYKKTLIQRNALLKEKQISDESLDVWDYSLAEKGTKIIHKRNDFINKLKVISREIHDELTNGSEKLEIIYDANIEYVEDQKGQLENYLNKMLKSRKNDIFRGTTGSGPHKDDLKLLINGVDVRNYGSQGQQRTAALSLKLAEIKLIEEEKDEKPILLLDDVLSELDGSRQQYLIHALKDLQIFITTTEISELLEESLKDKKIFEVMEGMIKTKEYI